MLTAKGTGGLAELRDTLDESRASFAYVRITYANDKESQREKFILVVWIGKNLKGVMRRAKVYAFSFAVLLDDTTQGNDMRQISVHASDVKRVLRTYSLDVSASGKDDLIEEQIVARLRKVPFLCVILTTYLDISLFSQAGGASYDGV